MSAEATIWAFNQQSAKGDARHLLLQLCHHANTRLQCSPTQRTLIEATGLSERQVRRCLNALRNLGLIEIRQLGSGMPNRYTVLVPDGELPNLKHVPRDYPAPAEIDSPPAETADPEKPWIDADGEYDPNKFLSNLKALQTEGQRRELVHVQSRSSASTAAASRPRSPRGRAAAT